MDGQITRENQQMLALQEARLAEAQKQGVTKRPITGSRIGALEGGIMLASVTVGEIITFLLAFIPGLGWLLGAIIKGGMWFTIMLWVLIRNLKRPPLLLASGGIDFIPIIGDILPTYIVMVIGIIMYNRPSSQGFKKTSFA